MTVLSNYMKSVDLPLSTTTRLDRTNVTFVRTAASELNCRYYYCQKGDSKPIRAVMKHHTILVQCSVWQ